MKIEIDDHSGFCYGVIRAIELAEKELAEPEPLFSLGDIVHNELEVGRLHKLGLQTITREQMESLYCKKILIRAHGEPPATYRIARENNLKVFDATCPVVLKLQKKVHQAYLESLSDNGQIVIYGKKGHAEVNGLTGQTNQTAIVAGSENDLSELDFSRPIRLFSQTTMSIKGFKQLQDRINSIRAEKGISSSVVFQVNDTICRQVANRESQLTDFAKSHDVILFVSGTKSSNGKILFEVCSNANPRSYQITGPDAIQKDWLAEAESIGICGGTSTPLWLMQECETKLKELM
ncbi:MAG: 4-hydroxy-3-methylbut-2-enyl diphosphate reductase [Bacteroidales bacterium]|nr:4-hydroxy-3-methylbut-2-enyl diphosphate reductase [Bacteroidales bacterium]